MSVLQSRNSRRIYARRFKRKVVKCLVGLGVLMMLVAVAGQAKAAQDECAGVEAVIYVNGKRAS